MTARITVPVALAAVLVLSGCSKHDGAEPETASAATPDTNAAPMLLAASDVAAVVKADLHAGVPVSGTLEADREANLTSPLDDVVEEVFVREGQRVAEGQALARFRLTSVTPAAASAAAQLKVAAADRDRMRNLFAEGAVSQRDVDAAEAAYRAADAANASAARLLADATVRAPFAGAVATRRVQAGDRVGTGDPLFTIVNTSLLEFEASVPSEYLASVKPGAGVRLSITGVPGDVDGVVARVNAAADPATRQVKVYVRVPNRGGRLVSGLFANGDVVTNEAQASLAVPIAALHGEGASTWAMAIAGGRLVKRAVVAGLRDEARGLVGVRSGLGEGDTIVAGPVEGLAEGQRVEVGGGKER